VSTFYGTGTHRLIYKSRDFTTGLTVTAYIWNASLTKSALKTFTEVSDGLYYLDYNFTAAGAYFGKFYEGGTGTTMGSFRVQATPPTVANILAGVIDDSYDIQDVLKILLAYLGGKTSGGGTTVITFRDTADGTDRVKQVVDADGNRSEVVLDVT
jgi:hypothetical protein